MQKKILLLLPDGIGLRNFLLTNFLSILCQKGNVIIWHALPELPIDLVTDDLNGKVKWVRLPHHHEGQIPYILRRSKIIAQLYKQREPGTDLLLKLTLGKGRGFYRLRNLIAELLGKLYSKSNSSILCLNQAHARAVECQPYFNNFLKFLQVEQPDIVFCSHQRSELAVPAMLAARKIGIPTATFIYSWDNLPKGRMAVHSDYYLVWSQHMQDELLQYYSDVVEQQIFIVGSSQFEAYFSNAFLESKETFLGKYGLNPARPVICFSGDDIQVSPHDPDYLEDLVFALGTFPKERRPQLIFRRNPTDVNGRYHQVLSRHPEIVCIEPAWISLAGNDWSRVIPTKEDNRLLVNIVHHSDLVVNVGSTMALDFAINRKPTIYIYYSPDSCHTTGSWSIEDVYKYPHFNDIGQFDPVYWARCKSDLAKLIRNCLDNPEKKESQRQAWVNFLVKSPLDQASQRCADALFQIIEKNKPAKTV